MGAGHLKIGDKIKQADGTTGLVANVITVEQTREMFNLTVSEAHTYYVGQDGWLVHNGGWCDHVVLGWRDSGLSVTTKAVNGRNLLHADDWSAQVIEAAKNPSTKVTLSIDGMVDDVSDLESVLDDMIGNVTGDFGKNGFAPAPLMSNGAYSFTDWEIYALSKFKGLENVNFVRTLPNGKVVSIPNPFR